MVLEEGGEAEEEKRENNDDEWVHLAMEEGKLRGLNKQQGVKI